MAGESKEAVFDALKHRNFKVAEMGDILGKSRQSIYNYVGAYVDSSQGSIPAFLQRLFSMCMSTEIPDEQVEAFWLAYTRRITEILKEMESTEMAVKEFNDDLRDVDNHVITRFGDFTDPEEMKAAINKQRGNAEALLKELNGKLTNERNELLSRPMSNFDPKVSAKVSRLSGPTWQGSGIGTVCVANSGNYMIIVNPESNPGAIETKLRLFTVVDDSQVYLKTMDFEKGSNMIQFSLIPQLVYRYEVIQITETEVKSSGVLDLKNYI